MFHTIKKIHFVGIGGIGMSGIAEILLDQKFSVSGSDRQLTEITDRLRQLGAEIYEGHRPENVSADVDVLVYSSAVTPDNPEVAEAARRRIPVIRRAEMLAEVMRLKYGVGIAGTHGKTTTTSLASLVLLEGGLDPTVIVGGKLSGIGGTNARLGQGDYIVVEADEFDRSFLSITPTIAVLTSLEADHLDCYENLDEIKDAFVQFANKVPFYGFIAVCMDEENLQNIMPRLNKRIVTYGLTAQADLYAADIRCEDVTTSFTVYYRGREKGRVELRIPGLHNVKNALAALLVGLELGVPFEAAKGGLEKFSGVARRTEIKYRSNELLVIDDYAHHPTEVRVTLQGIRQAWPNRRVVCVFQPHLFTRTRDMYEEFGRSFFDADVLFVTGVYPAREEPIEGVEGDLIVETAHRFGHKNAQYVSDKKKVPDMLAAVARPGDVVVTMGAGDIWKFNEEFVRRVSAARAGK
jgi:UDP-N-acetylmuramate--alanine ligase